MRHCVEFLLLAILVAIVLATNNPASNYFFPPVYGWLDRNNIPVNDPTALEFSSDGYRVRMTSDGLTVDHWGCVAHCAYLR